MFTVQIPFIALVMWDWIDHGMSKSSLLADIIFCTLFWLCWTSWFQNHIIFDLFKSWCHAHMYLHIRAQHISHLDSLTQIARFMGLTWGPPGADRTQVGPMLAPWTLLSGKACKTTNWESGIWQKSPQVENKTIHHFWGLVNIPFNVKPCILDMLCQNSPYKGRGSIYPQ